MTREERLAMAVTAIAETFEAVVREAETPPGGMRVPFHQDFADMVHRPGSVSRCRWWAARMREALDNKWPLEVEK
jgi:hypothetical protein